MVLPIGVIADDFTGATDIASFIVESGLRTVQLNNPESLPEELATDVVVISLKTRSIPVEDAIQQSLKALELLQQAGAERVIFKYCSTFDSTPQGNIGPVTDALLEKLDDKFTVVVPSLPVNGRTVYRGHLFVHEQLLQDSSMRHHPVTPMTDSSLVRLMEAQSSGAATVISFEVVEKGEEAVRAALEDARRGGIRYAVIDAMTDQHLEIIGAAVQHLRLVTGGSGLGFGMAQALSEHTTAQQGNAAEWEFLDGPGVVLSGSCSEMTNAQVCFYREVAPAHEITPHRLFWDAEAYRDQVVEWVLANNRHEAPLVYATAPAEKVRQLQAEFGAEPLSEAIESFFGSVAAELRKHGVQRFIAAGGETSGAVTQALGIPGFQVGPQIAPGVPWTRSLDGTLDLALKSGNFGSADFFSIAEQMAVGAR
ncbi:3-oxo-tetronate kinase [Nesterenkonia muleiensis]|uniref:3-oxo-tetronate kinase n=1 Tax=Nesterenkonia muleiensis TaxID=2282648 RepID=UPI000E72C15E|nr:3-oxo-tetronate kinase [Nesterenkonia muleiensis]